jgi:tetratricopeptide (TPR) repeat protein
LRQAVLVVEGKVTGDEANIVATIGLRKSTATKVVSSLRIDGSSLDWLRFINHLLERLLTDPYLMRLNANHPAVPTRLTADRDAFLLYCQAQPLRHSDAKEDLQRAAKLLRQSLSRDPAMVRAYTSLAFVATKSYSLAYDSGAMTEAHHAIESAERLKSNDNDTQLAAVYIYLAESKLPQALRLLEILETTAPRSVAVRLAEGLVLTAQGAADRAVDALTQATDLNPLSATSFLALGDCYFELSDYNKAIGAFAMAVRLDGDNQDALINLGGAYIRWGAAEKAIPFLQRALQLKPEASTYAALALGYLYSGHVNLSVPLFEKAVALGGETDLYVGYLGQAYQFIKDSRADPTLHRALGLAQAAARKQPTDALVQGRMAVYQARLGQFPAAEERIRMAAEEAPADLDIMYWQAVVQALCQMKSDALATLQRLAERRLVLIFSPANPDEVLFRSLPGFDALRAKYGPK